MEDGGASLSFLLLFFCFFCFFFSNGRGVKENKTYKLKSLSMNFVYC